MCLPHVELSLFAAGACLGVPLRSTLSSATSSLFLHNERERKTCCATQTHNRMLTCQTLVEVLSGSPQCAGSSRPLTSVTTTNQHSVHGWTDGVHATHPERLVLLLGVVQLRRQPRHTLLQLTCIQRVGRSQAIPKMTGQTKKHNLRCPPSF